MVGAFFALTLTGRSPDPPAIEGRAPGFSLTDTQGRSVSLTDYGGRRLLLYFSEGVGCDACFYQMVDIEQHAAHLDRLGISVLPIVVNPAEEVRQELARFGISTPFAIDPDMRVSNSYGVLGTGHHAGLPGHSFVLVDEGGDVRWQRNYDVMFVPTQDLLTDIGI